MHKNKRVQEWNFNSYCHLNGVIIGASLSDHYVVDKRDYNLGSGFSLNSGVSISYKDKFSASWWHEGFRIFTWKGYSPDVELDKMDHKEINYQGDRSVVTLNTSAIKVDYKLKKHLYLTGYYSVYHRSTRYTYYEDVYSLSSVGKLLFTYKF